MKHKALVKLLTPHVEALNAAAAGGSLTAKRIINLYRVHRDDPSDAITAELCASLLADWLIASGQ